MQLIDRALYRCIIEERMEDIKKTAVGNKLKRKRESSRRFMLERLIPG